MKKYLPIAASVLLLAACSEKPGYEITGTVSNSDLNGKYVYLYEYGVKDAAPLDSALVQNGSFALKGTQNAPALRTLRFSEEVVEPVRVAPGENAPFMATFVLENGKLAVVLDSTSTVSGTPENDAQKELQAKIKDLRSGIDKLVADMKSGDENLIKQAEAKYEEIDRKITETVVNYILAHTDKQSAAKNLYDFRYNIDEEQQNEIISKADSSFKSVPGISYMIDHLNVGEEINDFTEPPLIQLRAGKVFGEDVFEPLVFLLNAAHGLVDDRADFRGMRRGRDHLPAGVLRHKEDVLGVFVLVLLEAVAFFHQRIVLGFEAVGNVFEEDQAQHHGLVFRGVHIATQHAGRIPDLFFKADVGIGVCCHK